MKKLTLLLHQSDLDALLANLRRLGVVHLEMTNHSSDTTLESMYLHRQQLQKAQEIASQYMGAEIALSAEEALIVDENSMTLASDLIYWDKLNQQYSTEIADLLMKIEIDQYWGNISPENRHALAAEGVCFGCYSASKKVFEKFDFGESIVQIVNVNKAKVDFILVCKGQLPEVPFEKIQLSNEGVEGLSIQLEKIEKHKQHTTRVLIYLASHADKLLDLRKIVDRQISMHLAKKTFTAHSDGKLLSVVGWLPVRHLDAVASFLDKSGLAWWAEDPKRLDHVPVELRNRPYNRLFEPITRIFQLPNYFEPDLTPFVAVFYPIFFAYCLGDAGYGAVLTLLSIAGYFTFMRNARPFAVLGVILGLFTMFIGIVKSGTIFGVALTGTSEWALFRYLSYYVVITDDQSYVFNAFNVAIMVGVVQVFLAVFIAIYKKLTREGFVSALASIGKLLIISGTLTWFLANVQEVAVLQAYVDVAKVAIAIGMVLFVCFFDMNFRLLTRVGAGILPLFFIFSNLLGDVLSYVRLFALGVASAVLGLVVNQLGMQMMDAAWWGIVVGPLFLVFGHTLNMGLAVLGAFVHPLRLTFVEFYNNANFEGGGIAYEPFKEATE